MKFVKITQGGFDDGVAGDGDSLFIDFQESSLVDQILDGFQVRVSEGHEWLDFLQHVQSGGVDSHESCVVDLTKTEKSQDFGHIRMKFVNTKII